MTLTSPPPELVALCEIATIPEPVVETVPVLKMVTSAPANPRLLPLVATIPRLPDPMVVMSPLLTLTEPPA